MSNEELMNLTESELVNLINETKLKTQKLQLENLKKIVLINELTNNK